MILRMKRRAPWIKTDISVKLSVITEKPTAVCEIKVHSESRITVTEHLERQRQSSRGVECVCESLWLTKSQEGVFWVHEHQHSPEQVFVHDVGLDVICVVLHTEGQKLQDQCQQLSRLEIVYTQQTAKSLFILTISKNAMRPAILQTQTIDIVIDWLKQAEI